MEDCSDASSWSYSFDGDCSVVVKCSMNTTIASASSWSDQDCVVSDASDWREEINDVETQIDSKGNDTFEDDCFKETPLVLTSTPCKSNAIFELENELPLTNTPCRSNFNLDEQLLTSTPCVSTSAFLDYSNSYCKSSLSNVWELSQIMETSGCSEGCVTKVHDLSEHDILISHSAYQSKPPPGRYSWIIDYFMNNCPNNSDGSKNIKDIKYTLCGKTVCKPVWQASLGITTSRFYEVRKAFLDGTCLKEKRNRPMAPRTMRALSWMTDYFERVGDKRPDKQGIYLPSCLTERMIYSIMTEQLNEEDTICSSQFNKLFRTNFSHVSIPKVRIIV